MFDKLVLIGICTWGILDIRISTLDQGYLIYLWLGRFLQEILRTETVIVANKFWFVGAPRVWYERVWQWPRQSCYIFLGLKAFPAYSVLSGHWEQGVQVAQLYTEYKCKCRFVSIMSNILSLWVFFVTICQLFGIPLSKGEIYRLHIQTFSINDSYMYIWLNV